MPLINLRADATPAEKSVLAAARVASPARAEALAAFAASGLPHRRLEAWRYSDLRAHLDSLPPLSVRGPALPAPDLPLAGRIDCSDGGLEFTATDPAIALARLSDDIDAWTNRFDAAGDGLDHLAQALAEEGVVAHISGRAAAPLLLRARQSEGAPRLGVHRHRLTLAPGAELVLIEDIAGTGAHVSIATIAIRLGAGARLTHIRLQAEDMAATHLGKLSLALAEDAAYRQVFLTLGAGFSRHEVRTSLEGRGASAELSGSVLVDRARHADTTFLVSHRAPGGTSRQELRSLIGARARSVYQGKIAVARDAQGTDGYQRSRALLLAPTAEADVKPELEILADDVRCAHGASAGALEPEAMFYLGARGIPAPEARRLLMRGFALAAFEGLEEGLRAPLAAAAEAAIECFDEGDRP